MATVGCRRALNCLSMFEALKYRDFRWIWIGQTAHAFALWAQIIALPLLVLEITNNSAAQLGAVVAVRVVPAPLVHKARQAEATCTPRAGPIIRWSRKSSRVLSHLRPLV